MNVACLRYADERYIKLIVKIEVLYTLKKSKFTNSDQSWAGKFYYFLRLGDKSIGFSHNLEKDSNIAFF